MAASAACATRHSSVSAGESSGPRPYEEQASAHAAGESNCAFGLPAPSPHASLTSAQYVAHGAVSSCSTEVSGTYHALIECATTTAASSTAPEPPVAGGVHWKRASASALALAVCVTVASGEAGTHGETVPPKGEYGARW